MSFEQQLQQWVAIDDQLKLLNEKTKLLRDNKSKLSQTILYHAQHNNLDSLKIGSEKIKFSTAKIHQPITLKYLATCLKNIIKNEEQADKIINYIKDKREVTNTFEIKRFYNN